MSSDAPPRLRFVIVTNPAARLHAVLTDFEHNSGADVSVRQCWAATLNVNPEHVPQRLGAVLGLIPQIACALEGSGQADQLGVYQRNVEAWGAPIFFSARSWESHSTDLVNPIALDTLSVLSSAIRASLDLAPATTAAEEVVRVAELIRAARDAVATDTSMPRDVRFLIMRRLADVQWSLDEVTSFGADGVENAIERLIAAMSRVPEPAKRTPTFKQLAAAVGIAWYVFSSGSDVNADLKGWAEVIPGIAAQVESGFKAIAPGAEADSEEVMDGEIVDESPGHGG